MRPEDSRPHKNQKASTGLGGILKGLTDLVGNLAELSREGMFTRPCILMVPPASFMRVAASRTGWNCIRESLSRLTSRSAEIGCTPTLPLALATPPCSSVIFRARVAGACWG